MKNTFLCVSSTLQFEFISISTGNMMQNTTFNIKHQFQRKAIALNKSQNCHTEQNYFGQWARDLDGIWFRGRDTGQWIGRDRDRDRYVDRDEREKVNQFTVRDAYKVLNVSLYDSWLLDKNGIIKELPFHPLYILCAWMCLYMCVCENNTKQRRHIHSATPAIERIERRKSRNECIYIFLNTKQAHFTILQWQWTTLLDSKASEKRTSLDVVKKENRFSAMHSYSEYNYI